MRLIVLTFFLAFIASQCSTDGYKILGVFPINGKSHWIMMEAMMKGLAERGHQVDVITHFKSRYNNPNYREIILENTMGTAVNNLTAKEVVHFGRMNIERLTYIAGFKLCELLEQPQLQEIIKNPAKNPPYDLVITEYKWICYVESYEVEIFPAQLSIQYTLKAINDDLANNRGNMTLDSVNVTDTFV